MARFCRGQTRRLANLKILLLGLSLAAASSYANGQTLYERPRSDRRFRHAHSSIQSGGC
jgi:hypothetical protein